MSSLAARVLAFEGSPLFRLALTALLLWSLYFVVTTDNSKKTPEFQSQPKPVLEQPLEEQDPLLHANLVSILTTQVNPHLDNDTADQIATAIIEASVVYSLDPYLVLGVIHAESSARVDAVNGDCLGLMQVRISIWEDVLQREGIIGTTSRGDLWTVEPAVMAGSFILRHYLDKTDGDIHSALKLYSGGAGKRYIQRVTAFLKKHNKEGA